MFSKKDQPRKSSYDKFLERGNALGLTTDQYTDNLSNLSLENHKRVVTGQKEARKKARLYDESKITQASPTSRQQQGESIRFMDFIAQSWVDRHDDETIRELKTEYDNAGSTQAAKAAALLKFEKKAELHIQEIAPLHAGIKLGYATSDLCGQFALITKNKDLGRFATGLCAVTKAVDGVNQIGQASAMISQAAAASAAATTAQTSAAAASASMASGAMMAGAVGAVVAAGIMIYGMCAEEEAADNGLGDALSAIHTTVLEMWQDMREHFAEVFKQLDIIDEKITEMERQNWKRFFASMRAMYHYSESTREQLTDLKTAVLGSVNYSHQSLESYMQTFARSDSRKVVAFIKKVGQAKDIDTLANHSYALEEWLTQHAATSGYSGSIPTRHGKLTIETQALITRLEDATANEVVNKGSFPLGLYASLAQSIDPHILWGENLEAMVNPQDWSKVLTHYIEVIQTGMPLINEATLGQQEAFINEVRTIKNVPLLVLNLLSDMRDSDKLWTKLIRDYRQAVIDIQRQILNVLDEQRQELNTAYDIDTALEVIRLEQSAEENFARTSQMQMIKDDSPVRLQQLPVAVDNSLLLPTTRGSLRPSRLIMRESEYLTDTQVGFLDGPRLKSISQDPRFLVAKALKLAKIDVSCFVQNVGCAEAVWDFTTHIVLSVLLNDRKLPFLDVNFFCYRGGVGRTTLFSYYNGTQAQGAHGNPEARVLEVTQRTECDEFHRLIDNVIEQQVLQPRRKQAAKEILARMDVHRIDMKQFECARLKLLSFIKLLNPGFKIDLKKVPNNIKSLLHDVEKTGFVGPLQKLLNPTFGSSLLETDLSSFGSVPKTSSELHAFVKTKIKQQSLYSHRLWQTMARAYASIEILEQKLKQAPLIQAQMKKEQIEEMINQGVSILSEHHQQLLIGLDVIKTVIEDATPLVETAGLSADQQQATQETQEQVENLTAQFNVMTDEIGKLRETLGMDAIALQPAHPSPAGSSSTLPVEQTSVLLNQWEAEKKSIKEFSFDEAMTLLEQASKQMQSVGTRNKPAVLVVGNTGAGKSALINTCLGLKYKKERRKAVLVDSSAKEYAKTGQTSESETQIPNFCTTEALPFCLIDMAGFGETRGPAVEISNQMCIDWIQHRVSLLQGIIIVCRSTDFDSRNKYVQLRSSFEAVGRMIQNLPQGVENQVCVVVTDYGMTPDDIFDELKDWKSSGEFAEVATLSEDKTAILRVLSLLSKAYILSVDITEDNAHQPLLDKIHIMVPHPMRSYCFSPVSNDVTLMRKAVDAMLAIYQETHNEMQQLQQQLVLQLQAKLHAIQWPSYSSDMEALVHELNALDSEDENVRDLLIFLQQQKDLTPQATMLLGTLLSQFAHLSKASLMSLTEDPLVAEMLMARHAECTTHAAYYERILKIRECLDITPKMTHTRCLNWTPRMYSPQLSWATITAPPEVGLGHD